MQEKKARPNYSGGPFLLNLKRLRWNWGLSFSPPRLRRGGSPRLLRADGVVIPRQKIPLPGFRQLNTRRIKRNLSHRPIRVAIFELRTIVVYQMVDMLLRQHFRLE